MKFGHGTDIVVLNLDSIPPESTLLIDSLNRFLCTTISLECRCPLSMTSPTWGCSTLILDTAKSSSSKLNCRNLDLNGGCPRHALSCCSHWDRMEAICCLLRKKSSLLPAESWAFFNFMQMRAICCMLRANQFGVCVIWKPM